MNKIIDILSVKEGDEVAFVELFQQMNGRVFNFFRKKTRDGETAKDLTQQCFIRVYHYRRSLSEVHPIEKQLYIIAKSILLNHLRREERKQTRESRYARVYNPEGSATEESVQDRYEVHDMVDKVTSALPPVRRKVILLKARRGLSNQEIADELSISVKTVENHITKAHQQLRLMSADLFLVLLFTKLL